MPPGIQRFRGRKKAARYSIKIIPHDSLPTADGILDTESQLSRIIAVIKPPPKKIFIPSGKMSPAERIWMLTQGSAARKSSGKAMLEGKPDDIAWKTVDFLKDKRLVP